MNWLIKDYKEAARIRDSLKLFEEEEPVLRLRRLIKEAISDQRFQVRACVPIIFVWRKQGIWSVYECTKYLNWCDVMW
jgi:hypothetical protein